MLGEYRHKILIYEDKKVIDDYGYNSYVKYDVLKTYAKVKTTSGYTLLINDSDFEKALTKFTIRYPKTLITRDMKIAFKDKIYTIEYINNIDEKDEELEIQAKEIRK